MQNQFSSPRKDELPQHDSYDITDSPNNHYQRVYKPENYMQGSISSENLLLGDNFVSTKIKHLRKYSQSSIFQIKAAFEAKIKELISISPEKSQKARIDSGRYLYDAKDLSYRKKKLEEGEARRQALIKFYNEKTENNMERCERALSLHWKPKISELQQLLRDKESFIAASPDESMEEIRRFYELSKRQSLQQFESKIIYELNENYRDKYLENVEELTFKRKNKHVENMNILIKKIESNQYEILQKEKALFINKYEESNNIRESFSSDLDFSELHAEEIKLKKQATNEIKETLEEVSLAIEKALHSKFKLIDQENFQSFLNNIEKFHPVWTEETQQESNYKAIQEKILKKHAELNCKIKDDLSARVATEVSLNKNKIYEEISLDFQQTQEEFTKKIEEKNRKKFENIESTFADNFLKKINYLSNITLRPIEVKIKMSYHKRLDNARDMIKSEIEKRFLTQYKVFYT